MQQIRKAVSMYQLIRDLVAPGKLTDKSFDELELVKLVKDHHQPAPVTVQRYEINEHIHEGVCFAYYVTHLPTIV